MTIPRGPSGPALLLALLLAASGAVPARAAGDEEHDVHSIGQVVVKVFVRANPPDLWSPWQRLGVESVTGSGVVLDGKRVLTNAHVVADAVSIEVKRAGMSERYPADVLHVGHDCDLALLEVGADEFFEGLRTLPLGDAAQPQQQVHAYGFPIGGETLSISSGVISRVEVATYLHSMEKLLLAQIDAPLNPGNSGGPVVSDGKLVGVALQTLEAAENVAYMVPVPVVRHFLADVEDGRYEGVPRLGVELQELESESHRRSLGMRKGDAGALVTHVDHGGPASGVLEAGDVLVAIDGVRVANDMTVPWPGLGRVHLTQTYQARQVGETIEVAILRGGNPLHRVIELTPHRFLVPGRRAGRTPQYLVLGGLVFQPLTFEYLGYFEEVPHDLASLALVHNTVTAARRQLILLQKVLPDRINRGYHDVEILVVDSINGVVPRDMGHLAELLDTAGGPWLEIVTAERARLTLDLEEVRSAQQRILDAFGIARARWLGERE